LGPKVRTISSLCRLCAIAVLRRLRASVLALMAVALSCRCRTRPAGGGAPSGTPVDRKAPADSRA
jgi:hypothetical protein